MSAKRSTIAIVVETELSINEILDWAAQDDEKAEREERRNRNIDRKREERAGGKKQNRKSRRHNAQSNRIY